MEDKEREILERLKEKTEHTKVPESLSPEQIKGLLAKETEEPEDKEKHKVTRWKPAYSAAAAAACLVLVVGLSYANGKRSEIASKEGVQEMKQSSVSSEEGEIQTAGSYDEIYDYIKAYQESAGVGESNARFASPEQGIVQESQVGSDSTGTGTVADSSMTAKADTGYSSTNVRQDGVDEADIVKTDGRYLYTLAENGGEVAIIDTKDDLTKISTVKQEGSEIIREFYVADGKLILICANDISYGVQPLNDMARTQGTQKEKTKAVTYDVTDAASPKKLGEVSQSGYYSSSRMSDGYLYLFSEYHVTLDAGSGDKSLYIPEINEKLLPEGSIYLPNLKEANMYEVITSIDINKPDEVTDSKGIFAKGGELYASNENIYWYEQVYEEKTKTDIRRLSYKDGKIQAEAKGSVKGYLNDSFSIDEYEGNLRLVTTEEETNSVYILNPELEVIGSIENLAKGERVYSARLFGKTGYFVTFRETDPLFSVDLSEPTNPKIIGELKIPGFSEYLHFYGENKLLGIGMDVDEETGVTGGMKISMFDISNPADVKEVQKQTLENVYSADLFYDYKAVLIDPAKNMIGFTAYAQSSETYYVFSYDDKGGFTLRMSEAVNGGGYKAGRGVYINDILYVIKGNIIEAYDMQQYKKVDDIII